MSNTVKPRAPAARMLLEQAETVLAGLQADVAVLALEASEGKAGAEKGLAAQRSKIELAERQIGELRGAVRLAERLDREANAAGAAALRLEQLALFEGALGRRAAAGNEAIQALTKATKALGQFAAASRELADTLPTGAHLPVLSFGPDGGAFLGDGSTLFAREAFRISGEAGIPKPFFARLPALTTGDDHRTMAPAVDVLKATSQHALEEIRGQVARLNGEAMAAATRGEIAA